MGVAPARQGGALTVAEMKSIATDEDCFGKSGIRADGRVPRPAYPAASDGPCGEQGPLGLYKLLATTPADQAFRPLDKGNCPLVST